MQAKAMLLAARAARQRAYAPYSRYPVGAALLTAENEIFTGANIENASYGLTVCAERVALFSALHAGRKKFAKMTVLAGGNPPPSPCGACLQVLWELAGNIEITMANLEGDIATRTVLELLTLPFGSERWADNPVGETTAGIEEMWRLPVLFNPVGYVVSSFKKPGDIPDRYREELSRVVVEPGLVEGLYRLGEEEKINVISYLHLARGYTLKEERSGRGNQVYGVFACRAPFRPNAIAQSTVELIDISGNILTVRGLDLVDGTPVLDLKTVLPGS